MENPLQCSECSKVFSRPSKLQRHMSSHATSQEGWKVFCKPCGRPFYCKYDYGRHLQTQGHREKEGHHWVPTSPQTPVRDEGIKTPDLLPISPLYEDITPVGSPQVILSPTELCGLAESPIPPSCDIQSKAAMTLDELARRQEALAWIFGVNRTSLRLKLAGHVDGLLACLTPFHKHPDMNPGFDNGCDRCREALRHIESAIATSEPRLLVTSVHDTEMDVPL